MPLVRTEIQANLRKLRRSFKRAARRLTPEDVHKLRTRARRMVSLAEAHSLPALSKWDPLESTCRHASLSIL